ncbi:GIY-YIG nuclease family protein [Paraburkholderia sp. BCC1886]|uniref:GIY-YIG nuclease family protein n=1 Tax=Paraburkholderia sp. BCC1886 TaxID=2562670 RepID=UPI001183AAF1|nr:GIY-YIG nuclease family protein [Paraburkholderia sp. BCC1886]
MELDLLWTGAKPTRTPKLCGVYVLTHLVSKKVYVGSAIDLAVRRARHFNDLKAKRHPNQHLQRLFNKDPRFHVELFVVAVSGSAMDLRESAFKLEQDVIKHHEPSGLLVNIQKDVKRTMFGIKFTPEHRAKISAGRKGIVFTPEHKAKLSAWQKGRAVTPESLAKIVAKTTGQKRTIEQRQRLAEGLKKAWRDPAKFLGSRNRLDEMGHRVSIDGVVYPSISAAGRAIGLTSVRYHLLRGKRPTWFLLP